VLLSELMRLLYYLRRVGLWVTRILFISYLYILWGKLHCPNLTQLRVLVPEVENTALSVVGKRAGRVFMLIRLFEESRWVRDKANHTQGGPIKTLIYVRQTWGK